MKIKIISCEKDSWWYADCIGQVATVDAEQDSDYIIKFVDDAGHHQVGLISMCDAEVIAEQPIQQEPIKMNKPHKHAELIKAWADGVEIEYFNDGWHFRECPAWDEDTVYRIKPQPAVPEISLTSSEIVDYFDAYDADIRPSIIATAKYVYEQSIKAAIAQGKIILVENK